MSLSVNDLLACCGFLCGSGCDGGYPLSAWRYFVHHGVVTEEVTRFQITLVLACFASSYKVVSNNISVVIVHFGFPFIWCLCWDENFSFLSSPRVIVSALSYYGQYLLVSVIHTSMTKAVLTLVVSLHIQLPSVSRSVWKGTSVGGIQSIIVSVRIG